MESGEGTEVLIEKRFHSSSKFKVSRICFCMSKSVKKLIGKYSSVIVIFNCRIVMTNREEYRRLVYRLRPENLYSTFQIKISKGVQSVFLSPQKIFVQKDGEQRMDIECKISMKDPLIIKQSDNQFNRLTFKAYGSKFEDRTIILLSQERNFPVIYEPVINTSLAICCFFLLLAIIGFAIVAEFIVWY